MIKKKGFTLVELIAAVAVFSLGIVLIYEGFITCLNSYSYCQNHINAQIWSDQKIWDIQDKFTQYKILLTQEPSGSFNIQGKDFLWNLSYSLIEGTQKASLYELILNINWQEGRRNINFNRATYLSYIEEDAK